MMFTHAGIEIPEIYNTIKFDKVIKAVKEYCSPYKIIFMSILSFGFRVKKRKTNLHTSNDHETKSTS